MKSKAYFENISQVIVNELLSSQKTIQIAIAWFTDLELFDILLQKLESGILIELLLLNDDINFKLNGLDFSRFEFSCRISFSSEKIFTFQVTFQFFFTLSSCQINT